MVPSRLPPAHSTELVREDGRPQPAFRERLRHIPSWRNAWSVLALYLQTGVVIWAGVRWAPFSTVPA